MNNERVHMFTAKLAVTMRGDRILVADNAARAVDLLDSGGRKIGVASVIDGRIHAVVTDRATIEALSGARPPAFSIGYKVELATEPRAGGSFRVPHPLVSE